MDTPLFLMIDGTLLLLAIGKVLSFILIRLIFTICEIQDRVHVISMNKLLEKKEYKNGDVVETSFTPTDGWHWIWFNGMPIIMEKKTTVNAQSSDSKYILYIIGTERKRLLDNVLHFEQV